MPAFDTSVTSSNASDYIYSTWVSEYDSTSTATTATTTYATTEDRVWRQYWSQGTGATTGSTIDIYATGTATTDATWHTWTVTSPTGRILTRGDAAELRAMTPQEFRAQYQGTWTEWVDTEVKETKRRKRRERHGDVNVAARAAQRQQQQERQREVALQQERKRRQRTSLERSMLLLREACNDDQIQQLEEEGSILVVGKSGTRYKVTDRGTVANVHVLDAEDKISHRLCAHPLRVPQGDVMLAQKLMLEHDEEGFVKLANRHLAHGY